jgi:hypothetical protein
LWHSRWVRMDMNERRGPRSLACGSVMCQSAVTTTGNIAWKGIRQLRWADSHPSRRNSWSGLRKSWKLLDLEFCLCNHAIFGYRYRRFELEAMLTCEPIHSRSARFGNAFPYSRIDSLMTLGLATKGNPDVESLGSELKSMFDDVGNWGGIGVCIAMRFSILRQSKLSDAIGWSFRSLNSLLRIHAGRRRHFRYVIAKTMAADRWCVRPLDES